VFSDIAVAANIALRDYPSLVKRILIIDCDVHQGNGNAVLFANNSAVFTFSMHCSANYFSAKQHSDLDVEVPAGAGDAEYLALLRTQVHVEI
jgi:acetoin utilization deacetylase AcuC-like enzyme